MSIILFEARMHKHLKSHYTPSYAEAAKLILNSIVVVVEAFDDGLVLSATIVRSDWC
jgi:hypothetical protein